MSKPPIIRRGPVARWSKKEDEILMAGVKVLGQNWKYITKLIPGRNERQCRERYLLHLSPEINSTKFTDEEDNLLRAMYKEFGPRWERFRDRFQGRTAMALRNRWDHIRRVDAKLEPELEAEAEPELDVKPVEQIPEIPAVQEQPEVQEVPRRRRRHRSRSRTAETNPENVQFESVIDNVIEAI